MKIIVQQGRACHDVELPDDSAKIELLQDIIEKNLGVFRRNQKLIFKGKVLLPHLTAEKCKLVDGSKVMLMVSGGPTLGQAAAEKLAAEKADAAREKAGRMEAQKERSDARQKRQNERESTDLMQVRSALWKKTGIVALRDAQLSALPPEVWQVAAGAHTADLWNNRLTDLPEEFCSLTRLQKLNLGSNRLTHGGFPPSNQPAFEGLQILCLSHNRLSELPAICILPSLRSLDLSHNQVASLPDSMAGMTRLQHLNVADNELVGVPSGLGECASLADLILSNNRLLSLPDELGRLQLLQSLLVDGNRLSSIPSTILKDCEALHTINVHRNPLTIEVLREVPEFAIFDERRKGKYSKQMEMRVMGGTEGFDEGADHIEFASWTAKSSRK